MLVSVDTAATQSMSGAQAVLSATMVDRTPSIWHDTSTPRGPDHTLSSTSLSTANAQSWKSPPISARYATSFVPSTRALSSRPIAQSSPTTPTTTSPAVPTVTTQSPVHDENAITMTATTVDGQCISLMTPTVVAYTTPTNSHDEIVDGTRMSQSSFSPSLDRHDTAGTISERALSELWDMLLTDFMAV